MTEGMAVRFEKDYIVQIDPDPCAYSVTLCCECGLFFSGRGQTLIESMADSDRRKEAHACQPQPPSNGDEA